MREFERKVLNTLRRHQMLEAGQRTLVALSGGPDSVALLLALLALRELLTLEIEAAHVNHRQRGAESERDVDFVRDLCAAHSIPLEISRLSDRDLSGPGNLEEKQRRQRYARLMEAAKRAGAVIATGHTLDDQVETFFMKAARGAGPTGLAGIFPKREKPAFKGFPIRIIRPLLECTRSEVVNYLTECGQSFRQDSSNLDLSLDRNWLRHCLIPLIQRRLNPNLLSNIGKTAALCRELADFMKLRADQALADCLESTLAEPAETALNVDRLRILPTALRREVVRRAIRRVKGDLARVTHRNVDDVLRLLEATSGKKADLPGGLEARREFHLLRFAMARETPDFSLELSIPGEIFVKDIGKRILARRSGPSDARSDSLRLSLSVDSVTLRNRRPGDRFRRRGKSRKLKDLLQRRKIPVGRRPKLLIIESGGEIVWVEELGADPRFEPAGSDREWIEIEVVDETFPRSRVLNR